MSTVIARLQDAEFVVKFQKFCGIVPAPVSSSNGTTTGGSRIVRHRVQSGQQPTGETRNGVGRRTHDSRTEGDDDEEYAVREERSGNGGSEEEDGYVVRNLFLYHLFHFGANLGNEIFYVMFFPFWFWNIDGFVGRRVCIFWCCFMYIGQALKDIIKIPRPPSPPVFRLEKRYALEYGMPSTHAMVGTGMPFAIFIMTQERYNYHSEYALIAAIAWSCLVCCSRIYLGMHSLLDVIVGVGIVSLMLCCLPLFGAIDDFMLHSLYSPVVCILVPLLLCVFYPTLDKWSTARGDTTIILAVGAGVGLGHWVCYQYGYMQKAQTSPPYDIIPPTWTWAGLAVLRTMIGVVVLLTSRAAIKFLTLRSACYLAGCDRKNGDAVKTLIIELPYKFVTYAVVAFMMVFLVPMIFRMLGIERETFFTEI